MCICSVVSCYIRLIAPPAAYLPFGRLRFSWQSIRMSCAQFVAKLIKKCHLLLVATEKKQGSPLRKPCFHHAIQSFLLYLKSLYVFRKSYAISALSRGPRHAMAPHAACGLHRPDYSAPLSHALFFPAAVKCGEQRGQGIALMLYIRLETRYLTRCAAAGLPGIITPQFRQMTQI